MKNERGFSLLNIVFLIPIIFAFGMLIIASHQLISKYTDIQRECRTHVLEAQKILGKNLKDLLALNPRAQTLRAEEAALKAALKVPSPPPVIAALLTKLAANRVQQTILRGKQESLITSGKNKAYRIMSKLTSIIPARFSNVDLKVYKSPIRAIAPDHNVVPFFKEAQTIKVNWKYSMDKLIPKIVLKTFRDIKYPTSVEGQCAATLLQKGDVWNPKLHLAKF